MLKKVLLLVTLVVVPAVAEAQSSLWFGPRFGASTEPDQLVLGGQMVIGGVAPDLTLDPSIELGFGDDITTIQFNFDGKYHFDIQGSDWRPLVGVGIGIANYSYDAPPGFDDSETEVGINLILGTSIPTGTRGNWFAELRFGAADLPELKLIGGVNFPL